MEASEEEFYCLRSLEPSSAQHHGPGMHCRRGEIGPGLCSAPAKLCGRCGGPAAVYLLPVGKHWAGIRGILTSGSWRPSGLQLLSAGQVPSITLSLLPALRCLCCIRVRVSVLGFSMKDLRGSRML